MPAGMTNRGLIRQIGNDGVELIRFDRLANQSGDDFGVVSGPVYHVGIPHRVICGLELFEQKFPNRCDGAGVRRHQHIIACFRGLLVDWNPVDRVDQRTKQGVATKHEDRPPPGRPYLRQRSILPPPKPIAWLPC